VDKLDESYLGEDHLVIKYKKNAHRDGHFK